MKNLLFFSILFVLAIDGKAQVLTDIDNNIYKTVTIGTQIWMKENLATTKYNDGTTIPYITNNVEWGNLTTPAYCWYNNNIGSSNYKANYGALYNWYTVRTGKLCPIKWHVPHYNEWLTMINYLGGVNLAGSKLKESGWVHWAGADSSADNNSGFTALPGGLRDYSGVFKYVGYYGYWWSSERNYEPFAWNWKMNNVDFYVASSSDFMSNGFSVRCVMDNASNIITNDMDEISIYPNPTSGKILITNIKSSNSSVEILNFLGEVILKKQITSNFIDISSLKSDVYIVKIMDLGKIKMFKLLKE